jgi:hypothetical protein
MKPAKSITEPTGSNAPPAERPKPLDTLIAITEQAIAFRYVDRVPSLVDIGRITIAASRILHVKDLDEKISIENAAALAIAKKRELIN